MNEGSLILTSSVVERLCELGVSAFAFPRTRPSYPSRTIHVSHPLDVRGFIGQNQVITLKGRGDILENAGFDDCTHRGVHAGAIAARREDCKLHSSVMNFPQDLARFYNTRRVDVGVGNGAEGGPTKDKD
jgi:hypothetical protein